MDDPSHLSSKTGDLVLSESFDILQGVSQDFNKLGATDEGHEEEMEYDEIRKKCVEVDQEFVAVDPVTGLLTKKTIKILVAPASAFQNLKEF